MLDIYKIRKIMKGLAEKRPVFHSEADFQLSFAWEIQCLSPNDRIRLEYDPFPYDPKRTHLDVWLQTEGTAIELKYPKMDLDAVWEGERFVFKEGADDTARYEFLKDVAELEHLVTTHSETRRGVVILLTNVNRLWKPIRGWETRHDATMRIHQDRVLNGRTNCTCKGHDPDDSNPIWLRGSYSMQWQDFFDLQQGQNSRFRYLAVEVGN